MARLRKKRKNTNIETYLLEATSLKELKEAKKYTERLLKYQWRYYSELAELGQPNPEIIKSPGKLLESLLIPNWRDIPSRYDIPANSQIFGHLVSMSGIEGILYLSKLTYEPCLAIFVHNFFGTESYIQLDDEPPHKKVPTRIDGRNWRTCELSPNEIFYE